MTLKTFANVRTLMRHLPAEHRERPTWRHVAAGARASGRRRRGRRLHFAKLPELLRRSPPISSSALIHNNKSVALTQRIDAVLRAARRAKKATNNFEFRNYRHQRREFREAKAASPAYAF
jgi:hypothetical protein